MEISDWVINPFSHTEEVGVMDKELRYKMTMS
jgi:hypothetical protein